VTWQLTSDVAAFADRAGPFLRSSPVRHTVLLTVLAALRSRGPHAYGDRDPILGWWTAADGEVCGALMQTPPFPLTLTRVPPEAVPAAAEALAAHLLPASPSSAVPPAGSASLPGGSAVSPGGGVPPLSAANLLVGDVPAFTAAWQSHAGGTARAGRRTRLFRLEKLTPPNRFPPGAARLATAADRPLLLDWFEAFHEVIDERPADLGALIDDRLSHDGLVLWETAGTPVAMAACSRAEAGMIRIQYVYTPPEHRRQGFGAAATTAATRNALDAGASEVVLFTDLANPTSNALYPRLGYRPIEDRAVVEFSS
jgi:GNAT superfamily N-acetyltransferase